MIKSDGSNKIKDESNIKEKEKKENYSSNFDKKVEMQYNQENNDEDTPQITAALQDFHSVASVLRHHHTHHGRDRYLLSRFQIDDAVADIECYQVFTFGHHLHRCHSADELETPRGVMFLPRLPGRPCKFYASLSTLIHPVASLKHIDADAKHDGCDEQPAIDIESFLHFL